MRFPWSADNRIAAIVDTNEPLFTRIANAKVPYEIRLYQVGSGKLRELLRVPCAANFPFSNPVDIAFSPDGRSLAAALLSSATAVVFDAHTLQKLYELNGPGAASGGFARVAWSGDGRSLYAAGEAQRAGDYFVRVWPALNQGASIDVVARGGRMFALRTLPGKQDHGAGVLVAGEADWGVVDASSHWRARLAPVMDFLPTPDGKVTTLLVLSKWAGRSISLPWRRPLGANIQHIHPATKAAGQFPELIASAHPVGPTGMASVVAPNGDSLSAGYDELDKYDKNELLWTRNHLPSYLTTINVPASGQFVVAGYADGTIRWHRLSDGEELLALFAHADGKRWVLWTPSGYYDASPGGEELIGWHVNRGGDQAADFFPAAKFRNHFYRPDVIDRVLDTLDESQAVLAANAARGNSATSPANVAQILPPVVELISANQSPRARLNCPFATVPGAHRMRRSPGCLHESTDSFSRWRDVLM